MAPISKTLLLLFASVVAGQSPPTAVKKQPPDSSEKLHLEDFAFAPIIDPLLPRLAPLEDSPLRKRTSCPSDMTSCDGIGFPDKCCPSGTYCTPVTDPGAGQVACCPNGATCGGGVGSCPPGAVSCAANLGGGCCIPGYVCQGVGCVPSAMATAVPPEGITFTAPPPTQTITTTKTTIVAGTTSTVVVTMTVTQTSTPPPTTQTTTKVVVEPAPSSPPAGSSSPSSGTSSATGAAPWRPTGGSSTHTTTGGSTGDSTGTGSRTTGTTTTTAAASGSTQSGCPTGFYGCSAVHGGGCCRTERDCGVLSCPVPSSTIVSHGVTIVVPASDVPASATGSCAGGWFLCGDEAGPVAGCCPSGFECGTASCFAVQASSTSKVQKDAPAKNEAPRGQAPGLVVGCLLLAVLL